MYHRLEGDLVSTSLWKQEAASMRVPCYHLAGLAYVGFWLESLTGVTCGGVAWLSHVRLWWLVGPPGAGCLLRPWL